MGERAFSFTPRSAASTDAAPRASGSSWSQARWTWKRAACRDTVLSDGAKLLAVTLCDTFAHHETGFCNPRIDTIAEALGKSDRAVQRALAELRAAGWIDIRHGRGRGKTSQILFLSGGDPAAFASPEKVTPMAAREAERAPEKVTNAVQTAPEKVTAASPFAEEKVTDMARKGDATVTPYIEPKNNQKTRAQAERKSERPVPHLCHVAHFGTDAIADWDRWLASHRLPTLEALGILSSDDRGRGYDVPFRRPPSAEDALTTRLALRWADWAVQEAEVRHDR